MLIYFFVSVVVGIFVLKMMVFLFMVSLLMDCFLIFIDVVFLLLDCNIVWVSAVVLLCFRVKVLFFSWVILVNLVFVVWVKLNILLEDDSCICIKLLFLSVLVSV